MKDEFIELYTGIYKDLYRYALYILCNKEDAEDAVSEAVVDAYAAVSYTHLTLPTKLVV